MMNNPLRILEIVFSESWGGLEMNACRFALKFSRLEHKILMAAPPGSRIEEYCKKNNITFHPIRPKRKYLDISTARKLKNIIQSEQCKIIHCHMSGDLSTAVLAMLFSAGYFHLFKHSSWRRRQCKVVFSQHMDTRYRKKDLFHRWIFRHIDTIITVTEATKWNTLKYTPASHNQVVCIYNGVDRVIFHPVNGNEIREKYSFSQDIYIIGLVGRLDRLKKQELLVEAAPTVLEKFPNTLFIFVGEETDSITGRGYKEELIKRIEEKRLQKYFVFWGFSDNMAEITGLFDIAVLTTPKETFGMVLIEAMAMGIPVIGTNAGGVPEIIEDWGNGLLFEPDNAGELSECISTILGDKELRKSMGKAGIKRISDLFDLDKKMQEYERLMYALLGPEL
jgi:glycosyltransferase involved in cell wall biosynthesis